MKLLTVLLFLTIYKNERKKNVNYITSFTTSKREKYLGTPKVLCNSTLSSHTHNRPYYKFESSKCVQNTLEHLDPQYTKYQFKFNVKQLMCGI